MDLYERVRSRAVLHRAWGAVRSSGISSDSERTRADIRRFEANSLANLERIADQLRSGKFKFEGDKGITPPKGRGKPGVRPIVLAPIENRIVRRALLEVLQGYGDNTDSPRRRWKGVRAIREVMETPTSVGGVKARGVPHGLALIDDAVRKGNHSFARSDIKNFFTQIPQATVNTFVRKATKDKKFSDLFTRALATNLTNEDELEERNHFKLFPNSEIGVAQGSALSALAGNIALREFDNEMNGRGIVCVRYIDDFILIGPTERKVRAAYASARNMLAAMGMDAYELSDADAVRTGKAHAGNIHDGTDFLGYRISASARQPCAAAQKKFRDKLDSVVGRATKAMNEAASGHTASYLSLYHHAMVELHKIVWGWSQSFRHTTVPHVFDSLDRDVDECVDRIRREANKLIPPADRLVRRRVMGIHLLVDTPKYPLPVLSSIRV